MRVYVCSKNIFMISEKSQVSRMDIFLFLYTHVLCPTTKPRVQNWAAAAPAPPAQQTQTAFSKY